MCPAGNANRENVAISICKTESYVMHTNEKNIALTFSHLIQFLYFLSR